MHAKTNNLVMTLQFKTNRTILLWQILFKKENFKKKLQNKKKRSEEKSVKNNNKRKRRTNVFSYVDEFGELPTPPKKETEISLEDIQLGAAPIESRRKTKTESYFLLKKGYGFITEDRSKKNIFSTRTIVRFLLKGK